jgi:hypothetical protein
MNALAEIHGEDEAERVIYGIMNSEISFIETVLFTSASAARQFKSDFQAGNFLP